MDIRKHNFLRFLGYVRPYIAYLAIGVAGGIIKFTVPLLVPLVTRHLLDHVFLSDTLSAAAKLRQLFLWTGGTAAVFIFIYAPGVYIRHQFADKASHRAVFDLRCDLYYRILRMSASFFSRNKSGAIITRLISDVQLAQNLVGTALTNIWMDGIAVAAVLFFLFRIDPLTTLIALSTFPLYLFFFRRFSEEIRTVSRQVQEGLSVMSSNAQERISGNVVVRAFARERSERRRFNAESEQLFSTNMRRIFIQSLNQAVTGTLMGLSPLVVIAFGGWRVVNGDITVGDLMAVTMYLGPLYLPLQRFSELNIVFANGMAALDRIYEIMDEEPEIRSAPNAVDLTNARGRVEFDRVSFGYVGGAQVLHEVSFVAEPGEKIALVGASGSGKTTLVSLIPRFYDVSTGTIRVDGWDVRRLKVRSLRRHVSMVLQDPILFSGTIKENILYGNPSADHQAVIAAADAANALNFISALPNGLDTEVGERGAFLSGGQRQRITIARAFLKDPRVLVFDEATSSLDSESERLIQIAMSRLVAGRTTFIIAHRLSTVLGVDRILVLSAGRIIEAGTHEELMSLDGAYRNFYMRQLEPMAVAGPVLQGGVMNN